MYFITNNFQVKILVQVNSFVNFLCICVCVCMHVLTVKRISFEGPTAAL